LLPGLLKQVSVRRTLQNSHKEATWEVLGMRLDMAGHNYRGSAHDVTAVNLCVIWPYC